MSKDFFLQTKIFFPGLGVYIAFKNEMIISPKHRYQRLLNENKKTLSPDVFLSKDLGKVRFLLQCRKYNRELSVIKIFSWQSLPK